MKRKSRKSKRSKKKGNAHSCKPVNAGKYWADETELDMWQCSCGKKFYMMDPGEVTATLRAIKKTAPDLEDDFDPMEFYDNRSWEDMYGNCLTDDSALRPIPDDEMEEFA